MPSITTIMKMVIKDIQQKIYMLVSDFMVSDFAAGLRAGRAAGRDPHLAYWHIARAFADCISLIV